jgi:hypothetical protein
VSSRVKIELLASYSAGSSRFDWCEMHGGDTTMPPEDPWFCVRPSPGKCADFDDGSYVVAVQGHLPPPRPPPLPP